MGYKADLKKIFEDDDEEQLEYTDMKLRRMRSPEVCWCCEKKIKTKEIAIEAIDQSEDCKTTNYVCIPCAIEQKSGLIESWEYEIADHQEEVDKYKKFVEIFNKIDNTKKSKYSFINL